VQGELHICRKEICYFVVWSPKEFHYQVSSYSLALQCAICTCVQLFYVGETARNYELRLRLLSIYHRLEEILKKNILVAVAEEVFVNCCNFNPITGT
jgi:hypothetical protein